EADRRRRRHRCRRSDPPVRDSRFHARLTVDRTRTRCATSRPYEHAFRVLEGDLLMSENTLAIALGVGAAGGLLWYASRRKTDPRPPSTTSIAERPTPASGTASKSTEARPPERTAPTSSPLPGRWVWPVEVYQGRRSVITNPWSTNPAHLH